MKECEVWEGVGVIPAGEKYGQNLNPGSQAPDSYAVLCILPQGSGAHHHTYNLYFLACNRSPIRSTSVKPKGDCVSKTLDTK